MRMIKNSFLATFFLGLMVCSPSAHALDFNLLGILTNSNYSISPTPTLPTSNLGVGMGGLIGFNLNPFVSLETGVLYSNHAFFVNLDGVSTTQSYNTMEIPLLLRFSPFSLISLNGGIYYGIPTWTSVTPTTSFSNGNPADYGLMVSGSVRIPVAPLVKIRGDLVYEYGLANLNLLGTSQYSRNLLVLAGFMVEVW